MCISQPSASVSEVSHIKSVNDENFERIAYILKDKIGIEKILNSLE